MLYCLGAGAKGFRGPSPTQLVRHRQRHHCSARQAAVSLLDFFSQGLRAMASPSVAPLAEEKWWTNETVAVVTGANQGIGFAAAKLLASEGLKTVVAARNPEAGAEAARIIKEETGGDVIFHGLDLCDQPSIEEFAAWAQKELKTVDILINNAGLAYKGSTWGPVEARKTLQTNFFGTVAATEALLPFIPDGGRIVNVCSSAGKLAIVPDVRLRARFETASSFEEVAALAEEFVTAIEQGTWKEKGWPASMYGISKLCESTWTRILASRLSKEGRNVACNAVHPGYVSTNMSSYRGFKTPEQGADTPVYVALLPPAKSVTGRFFTDRREEPF
jgi:carbonyl reductase 1